MKIVKIDAAKITSEGTLHDVFYEAFGFPGYYGRNMNAWIDCMSSLDSEMNTVQVKEGEFVTLEIEHMRELKEKHPDLYAEIVECSAIVNWRRTENGEAAILALSFHTLK